jgi:uncharacterized membrane protein
MLILIIGLIIFIGIHMLSNNREKRAILINKYGEGTYKGAYSLISFIGLGLMIYGFVLYRRSGYIEIWSPPKAMMHMNLLFSTIAMVCVTAANLKTGFIKSRLKHPFLIGIKLWALGHLLANGDLGSMLIFGSLLAYSVFNRIQLKRRGVSTPASQPFGLPDILALIIGLGLSYWLVKGLHLTLIGVPIL